MLLLEFPMCFRKLACWLRCHIFGPWLFVEKEGADNFFVNDDHVRQCMRCRRMEYRSADISIAQRHY